MDRMIDFDANYNGKVVPQHTREALERYFLYGLEPGGFLTAMLTNNLYGAVGSADHQNIQVIPDIIKWLLTKAPVGSYGSAEAMRSWIKDSNGYRKLYTEQVEKGFVWRSLKGETE